MTDEKLIINKKKIQPKRLGMGLSALLGGLEDVDIFNDSLSVSGTSKNPNSETPNGLSIINIDSIIPNKNQPRKIFLDSELTELSESILKNGLLQPILVRKISYELFEIVAGERRYRASKLAGITSIPCIIKDLTNEEVFILAIIENVQRQELNPLEESESYIRLLEDFNYTQEQVASLVGKSRSYIANITRLSRLPESIKQLVLANKLTAGHTRPLLSLKTEEQMREIAEVVVQNQYSVRKVEELVNLILSDEEKLENISENLEKIENRIAREKSNHTSNIIYIEAISKAFHKKFEVPINIKPSKRGGMISIKYKNEQELTKIMQNLVEDNLLETQSNKKSIDENSPSEERRELLTFSL
jgi:ParB family chromosome partitioning protein